MTPTSRRPRQVVLDVVLRSVALFAGAWAYTKVYEAVMPTPVDADIGMGLILFGLVALVSLVWGLLDARARTVGPLAATWVAVGVVFAAGAILKGALDAPGYDASVLWSDVLVLGPFLFGLAALPAAVGGGLLALVRDNSGPPAHGAGAGEAR